MRISNETYKKLLGNSINTKQSKYHNKKVYYDGHWFDSQKEKAWYIKFKLMEKAGEIYDLKLQVEFILLETIRLGDTTFKKTKYIADFTYYDKDNKYHVVDVKGVKTDVYKLKKKLMAWKYGIEIEEI